MSAEPLLAPASRTIAQGSARTLNELLRRELLRHHVRVQRLAAGYGQRFVEELQRAEERVIKLIEQKIAWIAERGLDAQTNFSLTRLNANAKAIRQEIEAIYAEVGRTFKGELRDVAKYELGWTTATLAGSVEAVAGAGAGLALRTVLIRRIDAMLRTSPLEGGLVGEHLAKLGRNAAARILQQIRTGIAAGEDARVIGARLLGQKIVRVVDGKRIVSYVGGVFKRSRAEAQTFARTAVNYVTNGARNELFAANESMISGVQWISTLDDRTTVLCVSRDGFLYGVDDHSPLDGGPPWLEGPGALHFRAIVEGTLILTIGGRKRIEEIETGDLVLTHRGRWRRVTAKKEKVSEGDVVRVIHTQSGRVLRATDDHPVLVNSWWRFCGALKIGDELFHDREQSKEVARVPRAVDPRAEYGPAVADETKVARKRTTELIASSVDLNRDQRLSQREIEDELFKAVLRNPSLVGDESSRHHQLALGHLLGELRSERCGNTFALLLGWWKSSAFAVSLVNAEPDPRFVGALASAGIEHGDRIISLEVQHYRGGLFDLEVEDDASYVAGGVVVSNCRSTSIPVLKPWKELGLNAPDLPPAVRQSMNGLVPASQNAREFLMEAENEGALRSIFGSTRADALLSGDVKMTELFDDRGSLLTLAKLGLEEGGN